MFFNAITTVALAALSTVSAINIIQPTANDIVQQSGTFSLQWSTVPTDPTNFTLAYAAQDSNAAPVAANSLSYQSSTTFVTLRGSIFPSAGTYTLYLLDPKDSSVILAHTQPFQVVNTATATTGLSGLIGTSGTSGTVVSAGGDVPSASASAAANLAKTNAASSNGLNKSQFGLAVAVMVVTGLGIFA